MYSCRFAWKGQSSRQRAALQEVAGAIGGQMRTAADTGPSPLAALTDQQAAGRATAARTRSRVVPVPALPRLDPQIQALVSTLTWCSEPLCFRYLPAPHCTLLTSADSKIAHSEHMQLCTRSRQLRHCENTRLTNDRFSIAVVVGAVQGVNAGIYKDADVLNSQSAGRPITYRFSPGSMPLCPISGMHLTPSKAGRIRVCSDRPRGPGLRGLAIICLPQRVRMARHPTCALHSAANTL